MHEALSIHGRLKGQPMTVKAGGKDQRFIQYLFKDKAIKRNVVTITTVSMLLFLLLKWIYPFPDFFSDSYSYIEAARLHLDANIWPVGYSKFLLLIHGITHSGTAVVWTQYVFYIISALYFYYTVRFLFNTGKEFNWITGVFLFANPLLLFVGNYISSDTLFCALSLFWLTELLWMLYRPKYYHLVTQAIILFAAFTVRYNAMYYPLIGTLAILIARYKWWAKVTGIALPWFMIIPFILHSKQAAKDLTGTAQFPILSGWQWANNALYMYEHIEVNTNDLPTKEARELDTYAKQFFTVTPAEQRDLPNYVANYFIREAKAPLKQYLVTHYRWHNSIGQVMAWGRVSPIYGDFGKWLIVHFPLQYARYYLLVNTKNYFLPPLEKLDIYNLGQDRVWPEAARWFDWEDPAVYTRARQDLSGLLLAVFPSLFLVVNLYFLYALAGLFIKQGFSNGGNYFSIVIIMIMLFLLLNFAFSVFANIIVIRYQLFPMLLFMVTGLLMTEVGKLPGKEKNSPNLIK